MAMLEDLVDKIANNKEMTEDEESELLFFLRREQKTQWIVQNIVGSGVTIPGNNKELIFNDVGIFGASPGFKFDKDALNAYIGDGTSPLSTGAFLDIVHAEPHSSPDGRAPEIRISSFTSEQGTNDTAGYLSFFRTRAVGASPGLATDDKMGRIRWGSEGQGGDPNAIMNTLAEIGAYATQNGYVSGADVEMGTGLYLDIMKNGSFAAPISGKTRAQTWDGTGSQIETLLKVNGGLHVGGTSDPGDNNILVDGTLRIGTFSAWDGGEGDVQQVAPNGESPSNKRWSFGDGASFPQDVTNRAFGIQGTPLPVEAGTLYGRYVKAWDGSAYETGATIQGEATENWSPTAHGAKWLLYITPNESTTNDVGLDISETGLNILTGRTYNINGTPHTHASITSPLPVANIEPGTAQYQFIVTGAGAGYVPAWSSGFLNIAANETLTISDSLTSNTGPGVLTWPVAGATLTVSGTGTAFLATGLAGGQTGHGGTAANESLRLFGTLHATKTTSFVTVQETGGNFGVGVATPLWLGHFEKSSNSGGSTSFPCVTAQNSLVTQGDDVTTWNIAEFKVRAGNGVVTGGIWSSYGGLVGVQFGSATNHDANIVIADIPVATWKATTGWLGLGTSSPVGNLDISGTYADPTVSNYLLNATDTLTASTAMTASNRVMNFVYTLAGSGGSSGAGSWEGLVSDGRNNQTSGTLVNGAVIRAIYRNENAAPTTTMNGFDVVAVVSGSGGITNFNGIQVKAPVFSSTGGIVNNYGLNIANQGNALITESIGLYIASQSGSTNRNNAIYTNAGLVHFGDSVDLSSGKNITMVAGNIITDTTTGTKIGTATTQKLGFWNVTPIIQPAGATQVAPAAYTTGAFGLDSDAHMQALYDLVVAMRTALVSSGIMKGAA